CSLPSPAPRSSILSFPTRRSSDLIGHPVIIWPIRPVIYLIKLQGLGWIKLQILDHQMLKLDPSFRWRIPFAQLSHHIINRSHTRSEEHTSELQSRFDLVCRLLLEK